MRRCDTLTRLLSTLILTTLVLAGCTMGETTMPDPPSGQAADRSVGLVAPVPAPIIHILEGREACYDCHAIGAVGAPPVPENSDHGENVSLCTTCHAVWLAPSVAAVAAPTIPHDVVDRGICLTCHKLGTADAPRIPDHHAGLADNICQTCHTTASELVGAPAGSGEGKPTPETPTAPSIPHSTEKFSTCTLCHENGSSGVPKFPDDHEGRTDDLCTACHRPASEKDVEGEEVSGSPVAPQVPHSTEQFSTCTLCHERGGPGVPKFPDDHQGRTDDLCISCHRSASESP